MTLLLAAVLLLVLAIGVFLASLVGLHHPQRPAWTNAFGVAEMAAVLSSILFALAAGFLFKHALTYPGLLTWLEDAGVIVAAAVALAVGWRAARRRIAGFAVPAGPTGAHG